MIVVNAWGNKLKALRAAVQAAGADDVLPGGELYGTFTHEGPVEGKPQFMEKFFTYRYVKPSPTAGILQEPPAQDARPAPEWATAQPTPQPAQQAPTAYDPTQLKNLVQLGLTNEEILANIPGISPEIIDAIRATL